MRAHRLKPTARRHNARAKLAKKRCARCGFAAVASGIVSSVSAKATTLLAALTIAVLAVAITYFLLAGRQRQFARMDAALEQSVLAAFDEMVVAAERLDVDALFAHVHENDRGALVSSGQVFETRDAALADTRRNFERIASLKYKFGPRRVTLLSPDTAMVVTNATSEVTTADGRHFSNPFAQTVIMVREKAGWRVLHTHQSTPSSR